MLRLLLFVAFLQISHGLKLTLPKVDDYLIVDSEEHPFLELEIAFDTEDITVPNQGVVSVFFDGEYKATFCPEKSDHIDDCPTEGQAWHGKKSLMVSNVGAGLHHVVVQLIDHETLEIMEQESRSLYVLASAEDFMPAVNPQGPKFSILIFSKDRACQLDLLLRSLEEMAPKYKEQSVKVLYTYSEETFKEGYRRLQRVHNVSFVLQQEAAPTFKEAVLNSLDPTVPYTMFFVDDQVMTAPFGFSEDVPFQVFASNPKIMTLSLRMHPGTTYCYPSDEHVTPPPLTADLIWDWRQAPGDWGYPMSVDAHIFRTNELLPLLHRLNYSNPNEMEATMHRHALPNPYMICYPTPRVFNIPTNRVQHTFHNRYMRPIHKYNGFSPTGLNTEFLLGRRLSIETLRGLTPISPHVEIPLVFGVGARPRTKVGEAQGEEIYAENDPELLLQNEEQ